MKMKRKINKPFLASPKLSQLQIEKEAEKMESDTSSWSTIASMVSTLSSSSPQSRKTKHRSHYFMSTPPPPPPPPPPQSKPKQKRKPNRCSSMGTTTSTAFTPSIDNSENRKRPLCQSNALPMDEETENFAHDKHASCHQDQKCTVIQTKKSISSLEVEHGSSSTSSQPKFPRKQKTRRNNNNNKNCRDNIDETTDHYQAMDEDGVFRDSPLSNCSVRLPAHPPSSAPIPCHTHDDDDDETLRDFRESDWTPPDSSYGAAIPVAGWIPKPIRRMIESTLIVLGTVGLVYLIITTSIRITGDNNSSNNNRQNNGSVNGTQSGGNNNNNNMDYYYVNNQENNNDFGVANDDEYIVSSSYYDSYQNKDNNNNDNNAQQEDEEKGDDFYN